MGKRKGGSTGDEPATKRAKTAPPKEVEPEEAEESDDDVDLEGEELGSGDEELSSGEGPPEEAEGMDGGEGEFGAGDSDEDGAEGQEESDSESESEEGEKEDQYPGWSTWIIKKLQQLLGDKELKAYVEAQETHRPVTIRTNTLKIKRKALLKALQAKGMHVDPFQRWSDEGAVVFESKVPVGGTAEYLAGYYMVQSAASFLPVVALDPQENEKILDMSAAPGGKTTHICQKMRNTGLVYANDVSKDRLRSLQANVHRLGITNAIVINYNGTSLPKVFHGMDRVLLDAPCTGTGVVSRDPSIKTNKDHSDLGVCAGLQRRLILAAIDCCKPGGTIVYSTCSVLVEENEGTVDFALKRRHIEILDSGLPFGRSGLWKVGTKRYNENVKKTRRFYPHVHNLDGFFVAKIKKLANGEKERGFSEKRAAKESPAAAPAQAPAHADVNERNAKKKRKQKAKKGAPQQEATSADKVMTVRDLNSKPKKKKKPKKKRL